jgi:hypothetical protein
MWGNLVESAHHLVEEARDSRRTGIEADRYKATLPEYHAFAAAREVQPSAIAPLL